MTSLFFLRNFLPSDRNQKTAVPWTPARRHVSVEEIGRSRVCFPFPREGRPNQMDGLKCGRLRNVLRVRTHCSHRKGNRLRLALSYFKPVEWCGQIAQQSVVASAERTAEQQIASLSR